MAARRALTWRVGAALLIVAIPGCSGCRSLDLRGPGFDDEVSRWGQEEMSRVGRNSRERQSPGPFGFSTRAREIEANLGVQ